MKAIDRASELIDNGFKVLPLGAVGEEPPAWFFDKYKTEQRETVVAKWPKTPRGKWAQYRDDVDRWGELEAVLNGAPENCNLGIVTGEGVVVVDADDQEQVEYVKKYLTRTPYRVATSRGMHFYYKQPDFEVKNAGSKHGIDFRGKGGFVVAEGSIHSSGVVYTLEADDDFISISELPALTGEDCNRMITYNLNKDPSKHSAGDLVGKASEITFEPVAEGHRNNTCAQLTGKMIQKGQPLTAIKQVIDSWNETNPYPLSTDEVNHTISSICVTHTNNGGAPITIAGEMPANLKPVDFEQFSYENTLKGIEYKDPDFIVEGLFESGKHYVMSADGGAGKSFQLFAACVGVAIEKSEFHNIKILGKLVKQTGKTMYIGAEDNLNDMRGRLNSIVKAWGIDEAGLSGRLYTVALPNTDFDGTAIKQENNDFVMTEFFKEVQSFCKKNAIKFVVVDTMQSLAVVDLQSDSAAGQAIGRISSNFATRTGACVVWAHHMSKSSADIFTPADARSKIKGTAAVVDSSRGAYALWTPPSDEGRKIADRMGIKFKEGSLFWGAMVKANGFGVDTDKHTFMRTEHGLLAEVVLTEVAETNPAMDAIVNCVFYASNNGFPYSKGIQNENGMFKRKPELAAELQALGRQQLADYVDALIRDERLFVVRWDKKQYLDTSRGKLRQAAKQGTEYIFKERGSLTPYDKVKKHHNVWAENQE